MKKKEPTVVMKQISLPKENPAATPEKPKPKRNDRHMDIRASTKQERELLAWFFERAAAEFRSPSKQIFFEIAKIKGQG